jgi:hypothetical protein
VTARSPSRQKGVQAFVALNWEYGRAVDIEILDADERSSGLPRPSREAHVEADSP